VFLYTSVTDQRPHRVLSRKLDEKIWSSIFRDAAQHPGWRGHQFMAGRGAS
jgi:hypothetical protein